MEAKLFGGHAPVSKSYAAEHPELAKDLPADEPAPPPSPAAEQTAGGLMEKRPLASEPNIDPAVMSATPPTSASAEAVVGPAASPDPESALESTPPAASSTSPSDALSPPAQSVPISAPPPPPQFDAAKPTKTTEDTPPAKSDVSDSEERDEQDEPPPQAEPAAPPESATQPPPTRPATPGELVTGQPARPSQPAYYDATAGGVERIEDLAAEADEAYRERDYKRAEEACLKLLIKEPKNHKYMTRIGQVYQEMGNLQDAKDAYEAAKALDPKNFFVLNRLSEVERLMSEKNGKSATS